MYEVHDSGCDNYETMEQVINDYALSGEEVLRYLTDWHGTALLDRQFMENLLDFELEADYANV